MTPSPQQPSADENESSRFVGATAKLLRTVLSAQVDGQHLNRRRLRQLLGYAKKVFRLEKRLAGVRDRRQDPRVGTALVARILFLVGLLRVRSFNALEPKLAEPEWKKMLGVSTKRSGKVCSVDSLSYSLHRMELPTVRSVLVDIIKKAERNKVFREGWHGAMRFVAIDGWEPYCSRERCCSACLTREVTIGQGKHKKKVTEYYHRYVVALLLDEKLEVVLDIESVRSVDVRKEKGDVRAPGHEGELTAAKRLVRRLRTTYGRWLDVLVCDALYGCGPFLTVAKQCGFGVIAVLKKGTDEPLKEALDLWNGKPAEQWIEDDHKHEHIQLWDCSGLQTLSSYRGPIRVVRAVVRKRSGTRHTWCFAVTGKAARLSAHKVMLVGRGRWHLENTFNQWVQYWPLRHVFTHGPVALTALLYFFLVAFNLLQLFVYRQLGGGYGRDNAGDVTRTILSIVDEMKNDCARLTESISWDCWDTS